MPSNKLNEARTLYESEIHKVQKTPEKWKDFLDFAAKAQISKVQNEFEFSTKLIIHAKNPNATDCRLFGEWKTSDGNHVNRGERGIAVLSRNRNGDQSVTYFFDTSQTALKKEPELLEVPKEIKENLKLTLRNMVEEHSNNASFSDEQKRIFKATAEYKLCKQYGLETNDNAERFSGVENLSVKEIANIGVALNRCSQDFSAEIERNDFNEIHRSNADQSGNDRTELHGRKRRGMDLDTGRTTNAYDEVRLRRGSKRMEQAERGTGSVRADDLGTSAEADSSDGQVRQHETEIHLENSVPDRSDNAQRGTGSRGEPTESSLRGNERESSESGRADSGEEKAVGGISTSRGELSSEMAVIGEIQGRSRGGNSSSDSIRNITNETVEPEKVSAVSFSEKVKNSTIGDDNSDIRILPYI